MGYLIEAVDGSHGAEWDEFVKRQPGWTHYHLYGWRNVLRDVFSHESDYLVARTPGGAITAVLPIFRVRSMIFGDFMVSMPFLNYGGPLGDVAAQEALVEHVSGLYASRGSHLLELRCREQRPFTLPASHRKITVVLDLVSGSPDALWSRLDSKLRSQIRKPGKEGVTVRFGPELGDDFFAVFARNMRDLGTPTLPSRFFQRAREEFGESMWFGVAYHSDRPVAGGCGFEWNGEFELTWASSLRPYNRIAPNMLLYWSFIGRCIENGLTKFNFGRCSPDTGTHRFKMQWNSRTEQLWWYQLAKKAGDTTPSPDGKFSLGPRLWRYLPVPLATILGPRIVRYIP